MPILDNYRNGIIEHVVFCVWLISFCIIFFKVGPCCSMNQYFIHFCGQIIFQAWLYHIHQLTDIWGYFDLLTLGNNTAINLHGQGFIWTCVSFLWGPYPWVGFLGHRELLCLAIWNCQNVFQSCTIVHFHKATVMGSDFSIYYLCNYSHLSRFKWNLIMVWMTNDIEHLLIRLLVICTSSFNSSLFRAQFLLIITTPFLLGNILQCPWQSQSEWFK